MRLVVQVALDFIYTKTTVINPAPETIIVSGRRSLAPLLKIEILYFQIKRCQDARSARIVQTVS